MPRITVQINDDMERVLSKLANKRKISLNDKVNEVLQEYIDDLDVEAYNKSLPTKSSLKQ